MGDEGSGPRVLQRERRAQPRLPAPSRPTHRPEPDVLAASADELARSNEQLARYAASTAHDLKAPLTAISCTAQALVARLGPDADEATQTLLASLLHGASAMSRLVDDALRSAAVGADAASRMVSCDDVVQDALAVLDHELTSAGALIDLAPLGEIPGDRTRLARVFQNLIANAVRYHSPHRTPVIAISAIDTPEERIFSVADNGVGIDPTTQHRLFDPHHRVTKIGDGGGLGLAICRQIVEGYGGRIWIDLASPTGVIVSFALPRSRAQDIPDVAHRVNDPG